MSAITLDSLNKSVPIFNEKGVILILVVLKYTYSFEKFYVLKISVPTTPTTPTAPTTPTTPIAPIAPIAPNINISTEPENNYLSGLNFIANNISSSLIICIGIISICCCCSSSTIMSITNRHRK